ncbi:MAG: integrase family protein [Edaphobacter sp.]|nr:integrase family protein [Edaphobacter sp.]
MDASLQVPSSVDARRATPPPLEATDHEAEAVLPSQSKKAKTVLRLPDLEHAKAAVLNSLTSADAQRGYHHAIDEFIDWYCSEPRLAFNRIVVLRYRSYLESGNWLREPSTSARALCGGSRTKLPIAACSVRISRLAFAASKV